MNERRPEKPDATLTGSASWIYAQLQELAASLAPGTPLPPVALLKNNYKVGYETLNRVLKALEASGWVAIRRNKGIFALRPDLEEPPEVPEPGESAAPPAADDGGYAVPWLQRNRQQLRLNLFDSYTPSIKSWQRLVRLYNQRSPFYQIEITEQAPELAAEAGNAETPFDLAVFSSHIDRRLQLPAEAVLPLRDLAGPMLHDPRWHGFTWGHDGDGEVTGVIPRVVTMLLEYDASAMADAGAAWSVTPDPGELLRCARALQSGREPQPVFLCLGYMAWFYRLHISLCDPATGAMAATPETLAPLLRFLEALADAPPLAPLCSEAYANYYGTRRKMLSVPLNESWLTSQDRPGSAFVPMPRVPEGKEPLFGPEIVIGRHSFYPEECWNFIRFVLSGEAQETMGQLLPCVPAHRSTVAQAVSPARHRSLELAAGHGELVYTREPWLFEARFIIELLIERYLKREITADTLAVMLNERCNRFREKFSLQ